MPNNLSFATFCPIPCQSHTDCLSHANLFALIVHIVTYPALVAFWNALHNATLTGAQGNLENTNASRDMRLNLAAGTYFLGNQKFGSTMFVRDCYVELAEVIFEIMEGRTNLVLTGIPESEKVSSYSTSYTSFEYERQHLQSSSIDIWKSGGICLPTTV